MDKKRLLELAGVNQISEASLEHVARIFAAECEATIDSMIGDPSNYGLSDKDVEGLEDQYEQLVQLVGTRLSKFKL